MGAMRPSFNTAGPCIPGEHYMVPPARRLGRVLELIDDGKYFTLTAGRQTGKTTSLFWLVDHLNAGGQHCAMWVDVQTAREEPDPEKVFRIVLENLGVATARDLPGVELASPGEISTWLTSPQTALRNALRALAERAPRPLVVLFDEADGLVDRAMVSFLTQLRDGYIGRSKLPFPHSVALVGMRQVRDYGLAEEDRLVISWLGTSSPFNITAEAPTLATFTRTDVEELLQQHTTTTGQPFEPEAVALIYDLSQGHPWLANALADQIVDRDLRDRSLPITAAHVEAAKETILLERRTHIDSLIARLREPRVRRILDPMLAGEQTDGDVLDDDFAYVVGLGLLRRSEGVYQIANPIYREVIPRALTYVRQGQIQLVPSRFVRADGSLDMPLLMSAWQTFWRKDGHRAAEGFHYRESGPHLMLMAFLQRVVNGGGQLQREYALGRGALDLVVGWKDEHHAVEVKLRRDTETEADGIEQLAGYLDSLGLTEGWLVLFDLRSPRPWAERLWNRDVEHAGKLLHLVGC
jgi:hypothetical protein